MELKKFRTNRNVYINGDIDNTTLSQLEKDIFEIIDDDKKIIEENINNIKPLGDDFYHLYLDNLKYDDINIELTSYGGSVYSGLGIFDFIQKIKNNYKYNINCNINGVSASIATIIMLACDKRTCCKNTSFLIHSISSISIGKIMDIKDDLEECNRLNKILKDIYLSKTKLTLDQLNEIEIQKKDWWFDSTKALEINLVTEIIG